LFVQHGMGHLGIAVVPHHNDKVCVPDANNLLGNSTGARNRFLCKVPRPLKVSYLYFQLFMAIRY
jgi:hypothetical protein